MIADEMGLGKTVQGLALAAGMFRDEWPLLVLCPACVYV
jgi:SNF2 family DNA or RNA helicase